MSKEVVRRLKLFVFKGFLRSAYALNFDFLILKVASRFLVELDHEGRPSPAPVRRNDDAIHVLVLNRLHHKSLVTVLAARPDIRLSAISWEFLAFLLAAFVREPTIKEERNHTATLGIRHEFRMASDTSSIGRGRAAYRAFLRRFLPRFLERYGIVAVVNTDCRYRREADFSRVASECGYPHICLPRDAMFIIAGTFSESVRRHTTLGTFHGDVLLVQNSVTRDVFVKSGHARPDQVEVIGAVQAGLMIGELLAASSTLPSEPTVLVCTWPTRRTARDGTVFNLAEPARDTIRAVARLAPRRKDVQFVVKMKPIHVSRGQKDDLLQAIALETGEETPANIRFVVDEETTASLIARCTIFVGMQSTSVLEAGLARRLIILPHFKELRERNGADDVLMYYDCCSLYDVPDTPVDFEATVERRLEDPTVPEEVHEERMGMFERHVSSIDQSAEEACVAKMKALVEARRPERLALSRA